MKTFEFERLDGWLGICIVINKIFYYNLYLGIITIIVF